MTDDAPPVSMVFRESFLERFHHPEQQETLRVLDCLGSELVVEGRGVIGCGPEADWPARLVRGATGDLHQAIDEMLEVAEWIERDPLEREASRLLLAVGDAVKRLEPIAERLDEALAAFLETRKAC